MSNIAAVLAPNPEPKSLDHESEGDLVKMLFVHWGWITPGTGAQNRHEQMTLYLRFLDAPGNAATRHFMFTHCGWWLDVEASPSVICATAENPEPNRHLRPCSVAERQALANHVKSGRLDYVLYPYAACVSEATSGEALVRSLRMSANVARATFGTEPRAAILHDACYNLDWTAVQMPAILSLLGIRWLIGSRSAIARSADGSTVELLGTDSQVSSGYQPLRVRELYPAVCEHEALAQQLADTGRSLRAVTLSEYFADHHPGPVVASKQLGSKGWYGGTIDALQLVEMVKSTELRLPGIEAVTLLSRPSSSRDDGVFRDLWKRTLILMDNHLLWQCHDYRPHFLPEARRLRDDLCAAAQQYAADSKSVTGSIAVVNPLPWSRTCTVECEGQTLVVPDVPGWSTRTVSQSADKLPPVVSEAKSSCVLANAKTRVQLSPDGHIASMTTNSYTVDTPIGRLVRIHERPSQLHRILVADACVSHAGAAKAEATVAVDPCLSHVTLQMAQSTGDLYLLKVERLDACGTVQDIEHLPLRKLHWGGPGLPRHGGPVAVPIAVSNAHALRLTVYLLAEGVICLGATCLCREDGSVIPIPNWELTGLYENAVSPFVASAVEPIESHTGMAVRVSGELPDVQVSLDIRLDTASEMVACELSCHFPSPTPMGLSTPPLTSAEGSLLGGMCERPYVPGLAILSDVPQGTQYHSDKPYLIREALQPAAQSWHTDRRNWWWGMSPFIGMNLATATQADCQLGLLTKGLNHFFRWTRDGQEALGLSLGTGMIHPQTQGYSLPSEHPLYGILGRRNHDPYTSVPFVAACGTYRFGFGFALAASGAVGARQLWRRAREFAVPPMAYRSELPAGKTVGGLTIHNPAVVASGLDRCGNDLRLRLVNMGSRPTAANVTMPSALAPIELLGQGTLMTPMCGQFRVQLAPNAVCEVILSNTDPL